MQDTRTTGAFLGHDYTLEVISVPPGGDLAAEAAAALADHTLILLDAPAADILTVTDLPAAEGKLFLNVAAPDEALRSADCRANLLHTIPENAARTDAIMQVLARKQWVNLALIIGPHDVDRAFADHLRRSAAKFGLTIVAEKDWTFDTDLRESVMDEIPRFLQDLPDHDVLLVADETDDFGRYVEHNQWLPRPVAGSDGLRPLAWSHVIEAWGAVQLQNRFEDTAERNMQSRDYAAWAAIRAIGEAVTRTGSADPATLRTFMLSPDFQLDGFKGRALSFRTWNGQLRQPIAVANARARPRHPRPGRGLPAPEERDGQPRPRRTRIRLHRVSGVTMRSVLALLLLTTSAFAQQGEIWVTNEKDDTVSVIDVATLEVIKTYPTGERPRGVTFSKDFKRLYICASDSDTVQVMDPDTGEILHELPSGEDPEQFVLAPDDRHLYIANEDDAVTTWSTPKPAPWSPRSTSA